jgi:leader peptidase (prepilin peptidase) / N-methyltransferase
MTQFGWLVQPAVFPWVAMVFGLCVGSFLNVLIHRLPRMMERAWREECAELAGTPLPEQAPFNLLVPRSRCGACGQPVSAMDNIPLVSFVVLRGRCRGCKAAISLKYPMVELLAAMSGAYCAWRFGPSSAAIGAALFVWATIALAFIDQETGLLPDSLTLTLLWAGLLINLAGTFADLPDAVVGAAAGYLSLWLVFWAYKLLTGKDGMGYGDFKMNAAVGAFVGWKLLPLVILLSSLVGLVFGVLQMFAVRRKWESGFRFHFGPYLAIAGVIALFWGEPMLRWYMRSL